jgi:hypothetical protein
MLTGRQVDRTCKALQDAFGLDELRRLVRVHLNVRLATIVSEEKSLGEIVFDLVDWADRHGHAALLLAAAAAERPGVPELAQLAAEAAALASTDGAHAGSAAGEFPGTTPAPEQLQRIDRRQQLQRTPQAEVDVATTLLTWLIDRFHQTLAIEETIRRAQALGAPRPILFLLHGSEDECHDKFVERIVSYELGNWFQRRDSGMPQLGVPQKFLMKMLAEKPRSAADLHNYLRASLGHQILGSTAAAVADINSYFAGLRAPVVVHSLLGIGSWGRDERSLVHEYLAFWDQWPDLTGAQLLLPFLCIRLKPPLWGKLASRLRRQDEDLDAALAEFDTLTPPQAAGHDRKRIVCKPLPGLAPITHQDAAEWAATSKVQQLFSGCNVVGEIDRIYASQHAESLPMATLHRLLETRLEFPAAASEVFA